MTAATTLHLADPAATERVGARLASELRGGTVVTLAGDLGAGKTTLVRGALRALGWSGSVKSPSYTLVEHYLFSRLYLYHFDFYRFTDSSEWETVGFADCFRPDTVCLIEWPERIANLLPPPDLALTLAHPSLACSDGRLLTLDAHTEVGRRCLAAMTSLDLHRPSAAR
jgi:tRNA threonylcarbamoyladenosine biosynthesis protein TsaE